VQQPLTFGIVCGQRAPWPELVRRITTTERLGFDVFSVVDHFYGLFDVMEPTHEAYTALAALTPHTSKIRLGVMVAGNTYRNPAFLLKQAVTVDHASNGRVEFGVGAGWVEREHEAYGWHFPSARERVEMFAEALEIWDLLQRRERTTYEGRYYQLLDAPFEPKPIQGRLPILIGASGPRMLRIVARWADNWNARGTPEEAREGNRQLDAYCAEIGRDPATIVRSISPSLNFFASVDEFQRCVEAYCAAGFTDFRLPWPRNEAQEEVFYQVAESVLPALQGR